MMMNKIHTVYIHAGYSRKEKEEEVAGRRGGGGTLFGTWIIIDYHTFFIKVFGMIIHAVI